MSDLPQKRTDLSEQSIGAELMLADPATGLVHVLNPTTVAVWRALDGCRTEQDIVAVLRRTLTIPEATDLDGIVHRALLLLERKELVRYT